MTKESGGSMSSFIKFLIMFLSVAAMPGIAFAAGGNCGELNNSSGIGPWDYADPSSSVPTGADPMGRIKRVENVHFQPGMEALDLKLFSIDRLSKEFSYTLRLLPNNPRALLAMSRLEMRSGGKLPQGAASSDMPKISADCFFDRAIRFRPDDKAVRMVYGIHLHQRGKLKEALVEYQLAESLGEESGNLYYNLGLLHADMKNWDKAYEYGVKAERGGLMLPGLRGKLEKAGRPLPPLGRPEKPTTLASPSTSTATE
jgi:hypothetical protein